MKRITKYYKLTVRENKFSNLKSILIVRDRGGHWEDRIIGEKDCWYDRGQSAYLYPPHVNKWCKKHVQNGVLKRISKREASKVLRVKL